MSNELVKIEGNEQNRAVLDELVYANLEKFKGMTLQSVFYNNDGTVKTDIVKDHPDLKGFVENLQKCPDHYSETLKSFTVATAVDIPETGFYGAAFYKDIEKYLRNRDQIFKKLPSKYKRER